MTKRKIYFHVGLPKTGSTAIQAFLAQNVDALAAAGISYPLAIAPTETNRLSSGNVIEAIQRRAQKDNAIGTADLLTERYLETIVHQGLAATDLETVIFSSEALTFASSTQILKVFRALKADHDVTVIGFVRDVYDQSVSSWKQGVKVGKTRISLNDFILGRTRNSRLMNLENLAAYLEARMDVKVVNYDHKKRDLITAFMNIFDQSLGKQPLQSRDTNIVNASISYQQADLITKVHESVGWNLLSSLLTQHVKTEKDRSPDPYFRDIDGHLLERLAPAIETVNMCLPQGQKLRSQLRDTETKTAAYDFSPETMTLLAAVREAHEIQKNTKPIRWRRGLPKDFDPVIYLLLNPDVRQAKHDPVEHYRKYGRYEGRAYR